MPRIELCEIWTGNPLPALSDQPKQEHTPEEASIPWFIEFMRLYCRGLTPSVSTTQYMPSRRALAEFFGLRAASSFIFDDEGLPEYETYTRELFRRVLQLPWPGNSVLPFHFARGMLVEAMEVEVSWAEFAYRQTHPHQSHTGVPRVLPEFRDLKQPLDPLVVVMPRVNIQSYSPLSKADSENARREHDPPQAPASPTTLSPPPAIARAEDPNATANQGKEKKN
ncbi:hypothetical protein M758_UG000400 [Ceratodon purpureus]|nr:hypothetical protein M758_UG000400 [Ceratodon purpureus]